MITKNWKFNFGIILISVSVLSFLIIFALPFVPIELKAKIALTTTLIVFGEICFWLGTILIGKEVYIKFKEKLKSGKWLGTKAKDQPNKNDSKDCYLHRSFLYNCFI